ncbi:MAG: transcription factor FapR [Clostridiales bacterium]|nr:transcription factor FapR [Clostridiales bacterium]MCF8022588.1 transcription factor FapR [Clostridiales bacterium]
MTRQRLLQKYISGNPFLTDEDLSHALEVSIQTVRLDRTELKIPEMRKRIDQVAHKVYGRLRSLEREELVGELVDLEINKYGVSILNITEEMTLKKTRIARGHHIFAQANSLAVALVDTEVALTGTAKISYKRPVYKDEKVVAKAIITRKKGNKYMVRVSSKVEEELVFTGKYLVFAITEEVQHH